MAARFWDPWSDPWTDTMLADPPVAANPPEPDTSDVESDIPPPAAHTGLSRQLVGSMSVIQLAETMFSPGIVEPGLIRILNGDGNVLHRTTPIEQLSTPRMIYFQSGSWSHYNHMANVIKDHEHDEVLTRADERRLQIFSCRIFAHYVPVFRALDNAQRMLSMQTVINDNLEARIRALEELTARQQDQIAELLARVNLTAEPETEVEPRDGPPLEWY